MIEVKCSSCGKGYRLPDHAAGRKARCKACGEAMVVPEAQDEVLGAVGAMAANDDLSSLYGSSDSNDGIEMAAPADDPAGFFPPTSFERDTGSSPGGLPMKYIIGGAAGLVALIVVVLVVFSGGGGGDEVESQDSSDALAFDSSSVVPTGRSNALPEGIDRGPDPAETRETGSQGSELGPDTELFPDIELDSKGQIPRFTNGSKDDPSEEGDPDTAESPKQYSPSDGLLAPTSSAYAIMLPEDLELISKTRVAIRTTQHEDGTWLSMEVHKLAGLERRQETPLGQDGASVLLRGRLVDMPEGVEVSEINSDYYTAKRLLYPVQRGTAVRRVVYVIKDGPYLISVLGRYPVGDESRLAMLDEAAKSVQPLEDQ